MGNSHNEFKVVVNRKKHWGKGTFPVIEGGRIVKAVERLFRGRVTEDNRFQINYKRKWLYANFSDFQRHYPRGTEKVYIIKLKCKRFTKTLAFEVIHYLANIGFPADDYTIQKPKRYYYVFYSTKTHKQLGIIRRKNNDMVFEVPLESDIFDYIFRATNGKCSE